MIKQNDIEEIISLIHNGFDIDLLAFELDIPIEQLKKYEEQLKLRKFAKESVKNGNIQFAIEKLNNFIDSTDNNIVERVMLLKLKAYADGTSIAKEDLQQIELAKKEIGFSRDIDEILNELQVQIPRKKGSNIRKKTNQEPSVKQKNDIVIEEETDEEEIEMPDYGEVINKYKREIEKKPNQSLTERNLLAFTYFKSGRIDEARNELSSIIEQFNSYMAYRQIIHLEKEEENLDDAKLWAYEAIEKFPNSIAIREQLISIAREENDNKEIIKLLREINDIDSNNKKSLEIINRIEEK